MTEKRFRVIPFDANGNTVLIDGKGELIAVPLDFNIDGLTEEEKERLNEWLDLLNENEKLKTERLTWLKSQEELECLSEENEQLKQSNNEAIDLILDGIVEMHDGNRDYADKLLNKAIELIK